jgi:hypothetical protein
MQNIKRKTKHKIIKFHSEFPNRCICWILNNQTIGYDDIGKLYPDDIKYYTNECCECGYNRYSGPTEEVILFCVWFFFLYSACYYSWTYFIYY